MTGVQTCALPISNIGPRKRKSNQPLGMAARAQLVRKNREQQGELVISTTTGAMWMSGEQEQRTRMEAMAARHAEFQAMENAREVSRQRWDDDNMARGDDKEWRKRGRSLEDDDPILGFGKNMKLAGRTLWKRMSRTREASPAPTERQGQRREGSPLPAILIKPVPPESVAPRGAPSQELVDGESETGGDSDDLGPTEDTLLLELLPMNFVEQGSD